jgi:hypothetical protein
MSVTRTRRHRQPQRPSKVLIYTLPKDTDPKMRARILKRLRLERTALTYALGVAVAEAGIRFDEWPYRAIGAKEFRRGYLSTVTMVEAPHLTVSEDGELINKEIN